MSAVTNNKYSRIISNINPNSYRALKNVINKGEISERKTETIHNTNIKSRRNSFETIKKENNFKNVPILALKTQRFKWQTSKAENLGLELNGELKNYNQKRKLSSLGWDDFMNRNENSYQIKLKNRLDGKNSKFGTVTPSKVIIFL